MGASERALGVGGTRAVLLGGSALRKPPPGRRRQGGAAVLAQEPSSRLLAGSGQASSQGQAVGRGPRSLQGGREVLTDLCGRRTGKAEKQSTVGFLEEGAPPGWA